MFLYEMTTNSVGESAVRAYAWARSEQEARALFVAENLWETLVGVRVLFDLSAPPFCTAANDSGWDNETRLSSAGEMKLRG